MKRAVFTTENRKKNREGLKTQTRRFGGDNPWNVKVGDILAHAEPTQVLTICDSDFMSIGVDVLYPDDSDNVIRSTSMKSLTKLRNRKDPYRAAIARFMLDDFKRHYIRILDIREEYLQDISEGDAIAEGVESVVATRERFGCRASGMLLYRNYFDKRKEWRTGYESPLESFYTLWDSINTLPARQSEMNPIITAYTYEFLWELPVEEAA